MQIATYSLHLPEWAVEENDKLPTTLATHASRMAAVLQFARWNFERGTGGPFAAGVFERDSGRPIVIGVNRVLATGISSAHAEIVALGLAQKILGEWDLGAPGLPALELVVNWRPCVQCYGAAMWSGVRSLVIAGSGPELEAITGFDEGPMHPDWMGEFERRGIAVTNNVLREEAITGFRDFVASGAKVYNPRGQSSRPNH
jgi:tRNA(Arg) A34 adenosine deaminase TadA